MLDLIKVLVLVFLAGSFLTFILSFVVVYRFYRFFIGGFSNEFMESFINVDLDKVSIVIPVRNEEKRIRKLLESIDITKFREVIVVDDNSTDRTCEIVSDFGVKVIRVSDFYVDKFGKSIACYVGAVSSSGEFILFLDADVWFEDKAFEFIFSKFPKDGVLTILPYHEVNKFYELFSVYFNIVSFIGLGFGSYQNPYISFVGYFGPFLLIKKDDYLKTGGHLSVYDSIVEDLDLGKILVRNNLKIYSVPSNYLVKFRMYSEGFKELFDGWSKNIGIGLFSASPGTVLGISGFVGFTINIVFLGIFSIYSGFLWEYFLILYLIYSIVFIFVSSRIGNFGRYFLLYPIFGWFFVFVFLRSLFLKVRKGRVVWRGREVEVK